jgi:hypothetical protein
MEGADNTIVVCPLCTNHAYQWMLDNKGGHCHHCDFQIYIGKQPKKTLCNDKNGVGCQCELPPGYCFECCTKLRPIANRRANGVMHHEDWDSREFHKKCWKKLKNDGTLDDSA